MSVHGEYHRATRALLVRLKESEAFLGERWIEQLERIQAGADLDLSMAARASLDLLALLEADLGSTKPPAHGPSLAHAAIPSLELLRDACHHLHVHCRAILGVSPEDQ